MSQLVGYIATGLASLTVGLLLQRFEAKPKLLYWVPGSFLFKVQDPKVDLRTDALTVQNVGRRPATDVEIVHEERPDHFQFSTAVRYTEETNSTGEHVIKVPSLGPKEHINLQILSHQKLPVLLNVRSADGKAQPIQVHLQRVLPRWLQVLVAGLILFGAGFCIYWIIAAILYISGQIGVI